MNIVVAPHPDDEILGCYSILAAPGPLVVVYVTDGNATQQQAIESVSSRFAFASIQMGYQECQLDNRLGEIVGALAAIIDNLGKTGEPIRVYVPSETDYHSDHQIVAKACRSVLKPWKRRADAVYVYEVPSETPPGFAPTTYRKLEARAKADAMDALYPDEAVEPRDSAGIKALAVVRGGECGMLAAESFRLWHELKEDI